MLYANWKFSGVVAVALAAILLISLGAFAQTPQPMAPGPPPNPERPLLTPVDHAEQDFSFLRDPSKRIDVWDRIKYIPLNKSGSFYLTFGFETRTEYEWFQNQNWGQGPQTISGYYLQRVIPEGSLTLGSHLRIFAAFQYEKRWATTRARVRSSTKIRATSMKHSWTSALVWTMHAPSRCAWASRNSFTERDGW